jgi:hypothetical protein
MADNGWAREAKAWAITLGLLAIGVVAVLYLQRAEKERRQREAAVEYFQRTPPEQHFENLKKAARDRAAREK